MAAVLLFPAPATADTRFARLSEPGIVALMRHALAPGTGDPVSFRLDDCASQRNLDARGRAQARRVGAAVRAAGEVFLLRIGRDGAVAVIEEIPTDP